MLVKGLCFWPSYTLLDSFSDRVQGHPDGVVTKRRFGHIAPRLSGCALPELEVSRLQTSMWICFHGVKIRRSLLLSDALVSSSSRPC
ncbi:hypothetical protein F2Q70_00008912 [Brassica cretica]|uniref:Uncharacterized protein n=1 Tax=Brassica cretica TaxID=69181 RepID=A0A8S9M722_BRACR|nr:hypothetical protein F2Q70_00008912 [Brassica cretica]